MVDFSIGVYLTLVLLDVISTNKALRLKATREKNKGIEKLMDTTGGAWIILKFLLNVLALSLMIGGPLSYLWAVNIGYVVVVAMNFKVIRKHS